eukprot:TRINITY_DN7840_c0_g1_i1.p1 TRINITY_DN7840_c0_g1~~TRINITY_DN7840_c0_g1_i1.p1  ORF type:complete len:136 (+),score=23.39 TRINITY_DN7840_c0_g1_i1:637-1044(+)
MGPCPLWSTISLPLDPWSRSNAQWARGPYNPKTKMFRGTTSLCVSPNSLDLPIISFPIVHSNSHMYIGEQRREGEEKNGRRKRRVPGPAAARPAAVASSAVKWDEEIYTQLVQQQLAAPAAVPVAAANSSAAAAG